MSGLQHGADRKSYVLKANESRMTCHCLLKKRTSVLQVIFEENGFRIERAFSKEAVTGLDNEY